MARAWRLGRGYGGKGSKGALASSKPKLQIEHSFLKLFPLGSLLWLPTVLVVNMDVWSWFMSTCP